MMVDDDDYHPFQANHGWPLLTHSVRSYPPRRPKWSIPFYYIIPIILCLSVIYRSNINYKIMRIMGRNTVCFTSTSSILPVYTLSCVKIITRLTRNMLGFYVHFKNLRQNKKAQNNEWIESHHKQINVAPEICFIRLIHDIFSTYFKFP